MLNTMWELLINSYKMIESTSQSNIENLGEIRKTEKIKISLEKDLEFKGILEKDILKAINKLDADHLHYFVDLWLYSPNLIDF